MAIELDRQMAAYDGMQEQLEAEHFAKWVVFHDERFVGAYQEVDDAAREAHRLFGQDPYLIRQVGAPPITVPVSARIGAHTRR